ncbi:MAG: hypothetical protein M1816_002265 [Peltula sp. TS41687]|nr:MAG: hypothetical protein M1816_002265 [Peltula sp. TS41687]
MLHLLQLLSTITWIAGSTASPLTAGIHGAAAPAKQLIGRAEPNLPFEPPSAELEISIVDATPLTVDGIVRAQVQASNQRTLTWWLDEATFGLFEEKDLDAEGRCINSCMSRELTHRSGEVELGKLYNICRGPETAETPFTCNVDPNSRWKSYEDLWKLRHAQMMADYERRRGRGGTQQQQQPEQQKGEGNPNSRGNNNNNNNPSRFQFANYPFVDRFNNGWNNLLRSTGAALHKAGQRSGSSSTTRTPVGGASAPVAAPAPVPGWVW